MTSPKDFTCIGGLENHIRIVKETVLFPLTYGEVYAKFNLRPPRGLLFYGPPGTNFFFSFQTLFDRTWWKFVASDSVQIWCFSYQCLFIVPVAFKNVCFWTILYKEMPGRANARKKIPACVSSVKLFPNELKRVWYRNWKNSSGQCTRIGVQ